MPGSRSVAREAVIERITDEARRQLARDGAAALSLRSIARELGMVSSGIYRYVASRDELLTMLIVEAYDDLGSALERAVRRAGDTPRDRWREACHALRTWAHRHPHDYALVYGSPVPGYEAPQDTIGPATRVYAALASATPKPRPPRTPPPVAASLDADGQRAAEALGLDADSDTVLVVLGIWMQLFGVVSFELFGHTQGVITDHDAFFAERVDAMADALGI